MLRINNPTIIKPIIFYKILKLMFINSIVSYDIFTNKNKIPKTALTMYIILQSCIQKWILDCFSNIASRISFSERFSDFFLSKGDRTEEEFSCPSCLSLEFFKARIRIIAITPINAKNKPIIIIKF